MEIKKIFVAAPSTKKNGGGETLHQFVDVCRKNKFNAFIFYYDKTHKQKSVIKEMTKYNIEIAEEIEDEECNLLIFPEVRTEIIRKYKKIRVCIWFLSLEFYLRTDPVYRTHLYLEKKKLSKVFFPMAIIASVFFSTASFRRFKFDDSSIKYFLYNCEYARQYIEEKCNYKHYSHYLCGPLNEIYFQDNVIGNITKKEKIITYSLQKSDSYIEKIIREIENRNSEIKCIAIQNMTQNEVKNLFYKASVYLDFGFFPGPERLPREAVIMNCNIITGRLGSAQNNLDILIPDKYKFDMEDKKICEIAKLAIDMVYNYKNYLKDFEDYRNKVEKQNEFFEKDIIDFLEKVKNG